MTKCAKCGKKINRRVSYINKKPLCQSCFQSLRKRPRLTPEFYRGWIENV